MPRIVKCRYNKSQGALFFNHVIPKRIVRHLLIITALLTSTQALTFELTPEHINQGVTNLNGQSLTLHDPHNQYSTSSALRIVSSPTFTSNTLDSNGKHYWFYLPLHNTTDNTTWTFRSNNMLFDDLRFFWHCQGKDPKLNELEKPPIGFSSASLASAYYIDLTIPKGSQCGLLQKISVAAFYPLQNYIMPTSIATQQSNLHTVLSIIAFGVIIGLIIYNALLSVSLRSLNYFLYTIYAVINLGFLSVITWRPFSASYSAWPAVNSFRVLSATVIILFVLFTIRFMRPGLQQAKIDNKNPRLIRVCDTLFAWRFLPYTVMLIFIAEPILSPGTLGITARYYPPLYIILSLFIPILSLCIALTGFRSAWVFLTAWSILIGSSILGTLDLIGTIELNGWARSIVILATSLEMIMLSIALGMSIRESQNAKNIALIGRKNAEALMEKQEKFVSTLSHEIRTPLHAILGATSLLSKTTLDEKQTEYWNTTHYAAESMHALVDNLLDRTEIKHDQEHLTEFAPKRLVDAMVQLLRPRAEEKNIVVTLTTHNIPERLIGRPLIIRRLLINLISNSIKYTDYGEIKIHVQWLSELHRFVISVSDAGHGISNTQLNKLNQNFNKSIESLYSEDSSSGLGLAICHEMVNSCGGSLNIQSQRNKGTTVTAELNFESVGDDANPIYQNTIQPKSDPIKPLRISVLIVDDVASNRSIAQAIVTQLGATVHTAKDGLEALEKLKKTPIDLVLSDLRMPNIDGHQLLQKIVEHHTSIRVIITSAHLDAQKISELHSLGADCCLAKPYSPEQLEAEITNLFTKKHQYQDASKQEPQQISTSLAKRLGPKKYAEIIALFSTQANEDLAKIEQAITCHDYDCIAVASHRIVSASKALNFTDIANIASNIEDASLKPTSLNNDTLKRDLTVLSALIAQST